MESKTNEIKLVQTPIIQHQLIAVGKQVDERLAELNLDKLIATEDTVSSLKKTRAELNKESKELNEDLKLAIAPATDVISEVKELFKVNVTEKYKNADDKLKDYIGSVEIKVKELKESNVKAYFQELCVSEEIDFLTFENVGLEINLSTTEKKYKEQCNDFVIKVVDDLTLIKTQEFEVEIMVEYKRTLNVSNSIKTIKDRKESERVEAEKVKQTEYLRRSKKLEFIGLIPNPETKTYNFNPETYVVWENVKDLSKEEFENTVIQFDTKIKSIKLDEEKAILEAKKTETKEPEIKKEVVTEPIQSPKVSDHIKAPLIEKKEQLETVKASFEVTATYPELMKLKAFLVDNNFNYKNID